MIQFVKGLPKPIANVEVCKQLVRSAGSVGANYIEANEALSKKDFRMRIKICRKESKESASTCGCWTRAEIRKLTRSATGWCKKDMSW